MLSPGRNELTNPLLKFGWVIEFHLVNMDVITYPCPPWQCIWKIVWRYDSCTWKYTFPLLDMSINFYLSDFQNYAIFHSIYIRKLCSNPLTQLVVLLAPCCQTMGCIEPWFLYEENKLREIWQVFVKASPGIISKSHPGIVFSVFQSSPSPDQLCAHI